MSFEEQINLSTRIVIKIGTNVLMKHTDNGLTPDVELIKKLASQIVKLREMQKELVIVSSGSIGFGALELEETQPIVSIPIRQACAAVGQPILMKIYKEIFQHFNCHCAQLLLTKYDFMSGTSFYALRDCVNTLLKKGVIPIVNENDSVSTDEIDQKFGDNDNLSAIFSEKIDADLLIILTDVDGVYDRNPKKDKDAKKLWTIGSTELHTLLHSTPHDFFNTGSSHGTGGMYTKFQAAARLVANKKIAIIASAHEEDVLQKIFTNKKVGSVLYAEE